MKVLLLDIETRPSLAYIWSLWDQMVPIDRLIEEGDIICFSAKWQGEKKVFFFSTFHHGKQKMLEQAHALLSEADVVMTYNGERFDVPHIMTEIVKAGMMPPSPFKQIDLYKTAKKVFRFASNKLAHISSALKLSGKAEHEGFSLWVKCMAGDKKAWAVMRKYNMQDTVLLEEVYAVFRPWIPSHPHRGLYDGNPDACPACGSSEYMVKDGFAYTGVSRFQRFHCKPERGGCGRYSRAGRRLDGANVVGVTA